MLNQNTHEHAFNQQANKTMTHTIVHSHQQSKNKTIVLVSVEQKSQIKSVELFPESRNNIRKNPTISIN